MFTILFSSGKWMAIEKYQSFAYINATSFYSSSISSLTFYWYLRRVGYLCLWTIGSELVLLFYWLLGSFLSKYALIFSFLISFSRNILKLLLHLPRFCSFRLSGTAVLTSVWNKQKRSACLCTVVDSHFGKWHVLEQALFKVFWRV